MAREKQEERDKKQKENSANDNTVSNKTNTVATRDIKKVYERLEPSLNQKIAPKPVFPKHVSNSNLFFYSLLIHFKLNKYFQDISMYDLLFKNRTHLDHQ